MTTKPAFSIFIRTERGLTLDYPASEEGLREAEYDMLFGNITDNDYLRLRRKFYGCQPCPEHELAKRFTVRAVLGRLWKWCVGDEEESCNGK